MDDNSKILKCEKKLLIIAIIIGIISIFSFDFGNNLYEWYDWALIIVGSFGIIMSVSLLIIFIVICIETKITLKKYNIDELKYELSKSSVKKYEKLNIYLTDNYIISKNMGLNILEYKNVVWLYKEKRIIRYRRTGIPIGISLLAFNKKKGYEIAYISIFKKTEKTLDEVMFEVQEKNNNVMLGYTKENVENFKKIQKKININKLNSLN